MITKLIKEEDWWEDLNNGEDIEDSMALLWLSINIVLCYLKDTVDNGGEDTKDNGGDIIEDSVSLDSYSVYSIYQDCFCY